MTRGAVAGAGGGVCLADGLLERRGEAPIGLVEAVINEAEVGAEAGAFLTC